MTDKDIYLCPVSPLIPLYDDTNTADSSAAGQTLSSRFIHTRISAYPMDFAHFLLDFDLFSRILLIFSGILPFISGFQWLGNAAHTKYLCLWHNMLQFEHLFPKAVCSPHLYKHRMARIGETCLISLYVLPAILLSLVFNIPRLHWKIFSIVDNPLLQWRCCFLFFYVTVVSPNHVDVLIQFRKWQSRRDWVIFYIKIVQIQMESSVFAIYGWWIKNLLSSSGLSPSLLWDWIFRPTQFTSGRRRHAKYLHNIYFRRPSQQNPLSTLYLLHIYFSIL